MTQLNRNKSLNKKRGMLLIVVGCVLLLAVGTVFFINLYNIKFTQTIDLNRADNSLSVLVGDFTKRQQGVANSSQYDTRISRACRQVTFEMSKGSITCWVDYTLTGGEVSDFKNTYILLQNILANTSGVSNIEAGEYREQVGSTYDTNFTINFVVENVKCFVSGLRENGDALPEHTFTCSQEAPSFLPGYAIEE